MLSRNIRQYSKFVSTRHFVVSNAFHNFPVQLQLQKGNLTEFSPLGKDTTIENNTLSESNKLSKTLQRFWDKVDIKQTTNKSHEIQLDNKPLRTPLGNPLRVPHSKQKLAHLIAHEWTNLPTLSIKSHSLPLTSITARAIDLISVANSDDLEMEAKVGKISDIKLELLKYLDTDTLLVFSPRDEFEGKLRTEQERMYRPIISDMETFFTQFADANTKIELTYLDSDIHGFRGNYQTKDTQTAVLRWMDTISIWDLVALEKATLSAKSFLVGVAIVRANSINVQIEDTQSQLTLDEVVRAATLEIIYQTERWGEVEDTHDVDKVDIRRKLASASLLAYEE